MRRRFAVPIVIPISAGAYLLFTGSPSLAQVVAAVIIASCGTYLALRAARVLRLRGFRPANGHGGKSSSPKESIGGTLRLLPWLSRTRIAPAGIRIEGLDAAHGGTDTGRRGLQIFARSFFPNAYVIRERRRSLELRDAFANEREP